FFDRAAARWPEQIAVDSTPGSERPDRRLVTYRELQQQSDALAGLFSTLVTGECVVAILLARRSEHLYSSQLAVLKAGAAYACIDPAFPDEQVNDILADAEAVVLLTDAEGLARAERFNFPQERVFDVTTLLAESSLVSLPSWLTPNNLAYVIYTSG